MWFLVGLRDRLSQVGASGLPPLVFSAGLVFVTLGLVGAMIGTAVPASLVYSEEVELTDVDTLRVVLILGNQGAFARARRRGQTRVRTVGSATSSR